MAAVWNTGVELANWKQCEAVALATCNLEGWEPGRWSAGKKFIISFHFYTDVAEYFFGSLIGGGLRVVAAARVVRKPKTWGQWCKWQGLHFDGHVQNVFSSPLMRYNTKVICIINMRVGTQPLFFWFYPPMSMFSVVAPLGFVRDTYTFHTKQRRCTGSGSDPLPTSVCSHGQAGRQTGGLYKAPGVKYIIEKLWL